MDVAFMATVYLPSDRRAPGADLGQVPLIRRARAIRRHRPRGAVPGRRHSAPPPQAPEDVAPFFRACNVVVTTMAVAVGCEEPAQQAMAEASSHLFINEAHHIAAPTWGKFRRSFLGGTAPTSGQFAALRAINYKYQQRLYEPLQRRGGASEGGERAAPDADAEAELRAMVRSNILGMLTPEQGARIERGEAAPRATRRDSSIEWRVEPLALARPAVDPLDSETPDGGRMPAIRHRTTGAVIFEVAGPSFAGADLGGADLLFADLAGADLRGASLVGTNLCNADLRGARFDGTDMRRADVTLANVAGASFRGCDLADARLQAVSLAEPGPAGTDFTGADMTRVTIKNSNLRATRFADANLRRADLQHVDLRGADLTGADLTDTNVGFSDLRGARLPHATLVNAVLNAVDFRGADLRHAELAYAVLNGAELADAQLGGAMLSKTVFARCRGLHLALGLADAEHVSHSAIDFDTARASAAVLPDDFLAGVGLTRREVEALRAVEAT